MEAYVDFLLFHFPSCLSITNQDKPGTTVRRENTRSHSDLDIYVESSCAICTEIVRETWSKPGERARKLKKALAHWTRNPNCAISLKKKHNIINIGSDWKRTLNPLERPGLEIRGSIPQQNEQ